MDIEIISIYLHFALMVFSPVIIIIALERTIRFSSIIKSKSIRDRVFWVGATLIFSFLFVEVDCITVSFSFDYESLEWIRRPVGAVAVIAFYEIILTLINSAEKFKFDRKTKEFFDFRRKGLRLIIIALSFILFISPLYISSKIHDYFTALIGVFLIFFLIISIDVILRVGKILRTPSDRNFIKNIAIALIVFITVPLVNVLSILLGYKPSVNIFRVILVPVYLFAFYRASKNFLETRNEIELEGLK